eukprot:g18448.t1
MILHLELPFTSPRSKLRKQHKTPPNRKSTANPAKPVSKQANQECYATGTFLKNETYNGCGVPICKCKTPGQTTSGDNCWAKVRLRHDACQHWPWNLWSRRCTCMVPTNVQAVMVAILSKGAPAGYMATAITYSRFWKGSLSSIPHFLHISSQEYHRLHAQAGTRVRFLTGIAIEREQILWMLGEEAVRQGQQGETDAVPHARGAGHKAAGLGRCSMPRLTDTKEDPSLAKLLARRCNTAGYCRQSKKLRFGPGPK